MAVLLWTWWMLLSHRVYGQTCSYGEEISWIDVRTYEACATRVVVDSDKMMQFIQSINETFSTYYAFYDIARDSLDSVPLSYDDQYGYTVYNGTRAGEVDLAKELDRIYLDVERNGANLTTFWEVSKTFDRLLDVHVGLEGAPFGAQVGAFGPTGFSFVAYFSSTIQGGTYAAARLDFKNNGTADIMSMTWFNKDLEPLMVQEIRTMNDMSPFEFLKYFTSIEGTSNNEYSYKALGSRINKLLYLSFGTISQNPLQRQFYGNPAWFPPSIQVVFKDGTTDTWEAYVRNEGVYNLTEIEEQINTPGALNRTVQAAIDVATVPIPMQTRRTSKLTPLARMSPSSSSTNKLAFQIGNETADAQNLGVVGMEDYVVLKISTFQVQLKTVINAWNLAVDMAQSQGVDKLILDLSQNGGGSVPAGYALMTCMFPEASYETIAQRYNFVYSDLVRVVNETVWPFLNDTATFLQQESNIQNLLDGVNNEGFSRILQISKALDVLLEEEDSRLTDLATQLNNTRTVADMAAYISELSDTLEDHNAIKAVGMDDAINLPIQHAVRGGQNITLTGDIVFGFDEPLFNSIRESCRAGPFTKFAVLGDGTGGSTTCVVATFLQQTTLNGVNGPQVIAVSYGGTGDAETTPLTQFCGGSVLQPNLEDAYIPLGALFLLQGLLNTTDTEGLGARAAATFEAYYEVLPSAPYFSNEAMRMPVPMVYSKFMGLGAAPLEYINLPAQAHLRQWYTSTNFEAVEEPNATVRYGQEDLEILYNMTAGVAFTNDPSPPPPSPPPSSDSSTSTYEGITWTKSAPIIVAAISTLSL